MFVPTHDQNKRVKIINLITISMLNVALILMSACESAKEISDFNEPSDPSCVETAPSPADICQQENLSLATEAECAEMDCQTITLETACSGPRDVLCVLTDLCLESPPDPQSICEAEGQVLATEEECADIECEEVTFASACNQTGRALCRAPDMNCNEEGYPDPSSICEQEGLILADEMECGAGIECQTIEFEIACGERATALCKADEECMEDGRVEPEVICEGEGLELATEEECMQGAECQTITTEGPCNMDFNTLCKEPEVQCLAYPTCAAGSVESTQACMRGEVECEQVTECGQTISCRPENVCDAVVTCQNDEVQSRFACEPQETECRVDGICGETIFCRPVELCRAIPTCDEGELESEDPCLASESTEECRAVTVCSDTIICRQQ